MKNSCVVSQTVGLRKALAFSVALKGDTYGEKIGIALPSRRIATGTYRIGHTG